MCVLFSRHFTYNDCPVNDNGTQTMNKQICKKWMNIIEYVLEEHVTGMP
jgi:hypothetical protein